MKNVSLNDCVSFHGHLCGGVTMGYIMANYALEQLKATAEDDLYCRMECQNCMVDGVQCVTGCTIGKRNLELFLTGEPAMTLVRKSDGKGVRVTAKFTARKEGLSPKETSDLMMQTDPSKICHAEEATLIIPKK